MKLRSRRMNLGSGRTGWLAGVLLVLLSSVSAAPADKLTEKRPNFVVIVVDDLGYGDLGCYGSKEQSTPHIDRLALEGLRFTNFHANAPKCSPTRAALLTGRYPERCGVNTVFSGLRHTAGMIPSAVLFAEPLKKLGYATAVYGKWHVGYALEANPARHGFDDFRGQLSGGVNYFTHIDPGGLHDWWHNEKREPEKGYATDLITSHALEFIGNHKDQPFCLYVPYGAVHIPHMGPHDEMIVRYDQFYGSLGTYREMLAQVDLGVGKIVELLRALALDDQTFVFFTSDNGADRPGSNRPLRGWKGEMYEGGIRVPAIGWWPGKIRGGRQTAERTATMDLFPTLVALAGMDEASRRELALDGVDLTGLLVEDLPLKPRPLYFRFREWKAVIDGPWKLILLDKQWNTEKRGTAEKSYLYNLENDLGEQNNLVGQMPEMVDKLTRSWNTWSQQIDPELQRGLKWARRAVDNFGNAGK